MRTGKSSKYARASVVLGVALAVGFTTATPASVAAPDDPSLSEVKQRYERLAHDAEQTNERYLMLIDQIDSTKQQLKTTRKDVRDQRQKFRKIKDRVTQTLISDATDSPLGTTGELLGSGDPSEFIDGLGAMQAYNSTQSDLLASYSKMSNDLETREKQLKDQLDSIDEAKKKMAEKKEKVDEKADEVKDLLDELEAEQRQQMFDQPSEGPSRDQDRDPSDDTGQNDGQSDQGQNGQNGPTQDPEASGNAATAIAFAMDQIGEPYVYGAGGPDSWDCSGLTSAAWGAAGVTLPRSSSAQAGVGTEVSTSEMAPGDLVFYYSPISHVGIYLGNGQLVHAPHPGEGVQVTGVDVMPITTVRRVG